MTIVEFFDKSPIENIAGAFLCSPEKMIFVGDRAKQMEKSIEAYHQALLKRGIDVAMSYRTVSKNRLQDIVELLESIVQENDNVHLDLTGGDDLYLVAVGIIMERYGEKIKCHRFNLRNSSVIDCDADGEVLSVKSFDIALEDNILIHGGRILREDDWQYSPVTYSWDFNEEFCSDIEKMWEICRVDVRLWNAHIGTLGAIEEAFELRDSLEVSFEKAQAVLLFDRLGYRYSFIVGIMTALEEQGLISNLSIGEVVSFTYKNEQIKRCLTIAGQVLELVVASRLLKLEDANGNKIYHDVQVGVVVDWDGYDGDDYVKTLNEIDVVAMKDSIPVFISCKNGTFEVDELYKLNTVAERFGYGYSRKVVVATCLEKMGTRGEYIKARAEDMKIRIVDDVDSMSEVALSRALSSLWSN